MQQQSGSSSQPQENERYKQIKLLGEGSFGKAYLVECQSDGSLCVIKKMDTKNMSEQEKQETVREANILEALNHPCIVKFREVYKTKKQLCIVMDFCDGGDLQKKILEFKGRFIPESQIMDWFTQICLALKHIHDRKIIHRDLKAQNIFLMKDNALKLGDFGIAKVLRHTRENCKTMVGTPYYISPEIIEGKPYSFRSDIWSLGVILYEMCTQKPPFDGIGLYQLSLKIVRGQYAPISSYYSKDLTNLIALLLNVDPSKRPQVNQILKMPIIQHRIKRFLNETMRQNEFSHTVLHNRNFVNNNLNIDNIPPPMPISQPRQNSSQQQQNQPGQQLQQQQSQPQLAPTPSQQIISRNISQPQQNLGVNNNNIINPNNNNNNALGAFLSPQNRNIQIPQSKPIQQNQQPSQQQNVLGYIPQNQQQPQNNYQLYQKQQQPQQQQQQQQQLPAQNNYMKNNNKNDLTPSPGLGTAATPAQNGGVIGYKINNNNYLQNNNNQTPIPPLFQKIQSDQTPQTAQQQQQQQQKMPILGAGNNLIAQNAQKQQQLLNQQKLQFVENNNDLKRPNVGNLNAQDFLPTPIEKLRREVSEPVFVQKSKPLFENIEQKKQAMQLKEKALEKKIEEIKAENKKEQQYKKIYDHLKSEESVPISNNNNNYNPNNYKVNNNNSNLIAPPTKRESNGQQQSAQNLGNSKKNLKNQLQQSSVEDKEKRKQKRDEERKNMYEDIKMQRQKKLMESQEMKQDQKIEFFSNLKPPKEDIHVESQTKDEIDNKKSSKKLSQRDIPIEIYESKKPVNNNQQYQQQQLYQNNNINYNYNIPTTQQNNNVKQNQRYNVQDSNYSPSKQQYLPSERQNSQGSKDLAFEREEMTYIPKENKEIMQQLLECLGDEEVIDIDYNSSNSDNSEQREKQNRLAQELDKSVNEIQQRYLNNLERDSDDDEEIDLDESQQSHKKLQQRLKEINERSDDEDNKSSSDSEYDSKMVEKEWEECQSREDSDFEDEEYISSEINYNKVKDKIKKEFLNKDEEYSYNKAPKAQNDQKQKQKKEYQINQQQKENIPSNINYSVQTPTTASSNKSESYEESKLESLKYILEDKLGKVPLQLSIKQLKGYIGDLNKSQNSKDDFNDEGDYSLFNDLSKLFVSIPSQLADDYGPLVIMYYNMCISSDC